MYQKLGETKQPIKELVKVKVIKITAHAILVQLLDFNDGEVWFPLFYATELTHVEGKPSTLVVPQWILNRKVLALAAGIPARAVRNGKQWNVTVAAKKMMHEAELRNKGFSKELYND